MEYTYRVSINHNIYNNKNSRVIQWLKENCTGKWSYQSPSGHITNKSEGEIIFFEEQDAIAFKLNWT